MTQETPNHRQNTLQEPDQSDLLELDSEYEAEEINDWEFDAVEKD